MTDGMTVRSLSASLQRKTSAATDRLCQMALNRKLWRKFEKKGVHLQVALKRNRVKLDLPVQTTGIVNQQQISNSNTKTYVSIPVRCQFRLCNLYVMSFASGIIYRQMFADKVNRSDEDSSL